MNKEYYEGVDGLSHENEIIKPQYEIKGYSIVVINRKAESKDKVYWLKPGRLKGKHINIPKSLAKGVKITNDMFECYLPNWFIDKQNLKSFIHNES